MSYAAGADWEDATGRFLREIDRIRSEATVIAALSVLFFSSLSSVILSYTIETIGGNHTFGDDYWLIAIASTDLVPGLPHYGGCWVLDVGCYVSISVRCTE